MSRRESRNASSGLVVAACCASLLMAAGCSKAISGAVVGKAGAVEVSAKELEGILTNFPEQTRRAVASDQSALERVVRAELVRRSLLAEARDARFDSDAAIQNDLDRVRDDAIVRLWVAKQGKVPDAYPGEDDLRIAYEANKAALAAPPQYRVAQIFVSAPNGIDAEHLATAMRKAADVGSKIPGGDFAALAREYSEHAESAARGGDVGLLPADRMLPEIVAAVGRLDVGAVTGPVKTSQGLHYVKLLERKLADPPSIEAARGQLVAALRTRRAQELEQAYLAQLNSKLNVSVDQIALAQVDPAGK